MHRPIFTALVVVSLTACVDSPTAPPRSPLPDGGQSELLPNGEGDFHRYVAIGTSVSQGWRSDGVNATSQLSSWPAQLARLANRELSLPLISGPGCGAPLIAPLGSGLRVGGELAATPFLSRTCAANEAGVTLPAGNVAISGARTIHALNATPEAPDPNYAPLYQRVLPSGMSQVTAMEAQNPKIVSVELGANEILGVHHGAVVPGQTVVPVALWAPDYRTVLDRVQAEAKKAVVVGLVDHAISFPSFRTGAELWEARATFVPLHVTVSEDCSVAPGKDNALFVPVRVLVAAATGGARRQQGLSPFVLSCANAPPTDANGDVIRDYVLSPAEMAAIDAQFAAMNAVMRAEAESRGFAYFALSALYDETVTKDPFNAITMLTSQEPFGPYVSLDGLHPSAEGARVLAEAAAAALNTRYNMAIPTGAAPLFAGRRASASR
ncbi:MAG TPA: SGNH/GDSL hydrolase family protein [Gemmatimonadaceae bacterium]|nr:SGNH/GDSL hydrolase family protein [Gemmatimonadaceae bacterium]